MKITIDGSSSMFGLTTESLKLSAVQALLRRRGIIVTHLDSKHAVLESANGAFFDASFQQEIEKIKKKHVHNLKKEPIVEERPAESNECSWSVLNGFMIALGVGVVATALIVLSGTSWIIAASIGIGVGIGAMLTYGLFLRVSEEKQDLSSPLSPSVV